MRILTWNIQNCGTVNFNQPQRENIKSILCEIEKLQADIVVLQEFQFEYYSEIVEKGLNQFGYVCTVCNDNTDRTLRNRVLIAVKSKYSFSDCEYPKDIRKYSRRNWREIIIQNSNIAVFGVDVPIAQTTDMYGRKKDNRAEKKQFLEALKSKFTEYANYDYPAIILGDFNLHENAVFKEYLPLFNDILFEVTAKEPTWENYKIDYIFVNSKMKELIDDSRIFKPHDTDYSDHKYLYVDIKENGISF